MEERHTALNIAKNLLDILQEWEIPLEKTVAVVTDNGAHMIAAIKSIEGIWQSKHIRCFAHTLNLVAEVVVGNNSVKPFISKVRQIAKRIKDSVVISDLLRNKET